MDTFKKLTTILVLSLISTVAFAIDGYKEFKFGASEKEIRNLLKCNYIETGKTLYSYMFPDIDEPEKRIKQIDCKEYRFLEKEGSVTFEFIDDQLKRIMFKPNVSRYFSEYLLESYRKKYGEETDSKIGGNYELFYFNEKLIEFQLYDVPDNSLYIRYISPDYKKALYGQITDI